jgi:Lar family restriction alleviation protein
MTSKEQRVGCKGCKQDEGGFPHIVEGCPIHDPQWGIADPYRSGPSPESRLEIRDTGHCTLKEPVGGKLDVRNIEPTDTERLLPCPFCGSTVIVVREGNKGYWKYVECGHCKAKANSYMTIETAITAWNRRSK